MPGGSRSVWQLKHLAECLQMWCRYIVTNGKPWWHPGPPLPTPPRKRQSSLAQVRCKGLTSAGALRRGTLHSRPSFFLDQHSLTVCTAWFERRNMIVCGPMSSRAPGRVRDLKIQPARICSRGVADKQPPRPSYQPYRGTVSCPTQPANSK